MLPDIPQKEGVLGVIRMPGAGREIKLFRSLFPAWRFCQRYNNISMDLWYLVSCLAAVPKRSWILGLHALTSDLYRSIVTGMLYC